MLKILEANCKSLPYSFIDRKQRPIILRKASQKDYNDILKMYQDFEPKESYQGLPPSNPDRLIEWVQLMMNTGFNIIGVTFDKRVVCHGSIFAIDSERCEFILAVFPEYQNAGTGIHLTRMIKTAAKEFGFSRIWLCVESTNIKAKHIYTKLGFEITASAFGEETEMSLDLKSEPALLARVDSIMTKKVIFLRQDKKVEEAIDLFLSQDISGMPIVGLNHELVGFITETDLLESWTKVRNVSEIMTREVHYVYKDSKIFEVVDMILNLRKKQVPIVDRKKKLVGIITRKELLKYLHREEHLHEGSSKKK